MTGEDLIWHVVIAGEQQGPLSRTQILDYLHDERLVGSDLIWRPGFSDWKSISSVADFWQPPKRGSLRPSPQPTPAEPPELDSDPINAVATGRKWSIWKAANAGLLVSLLPLTLQIVSGRGVELASYAQTASAEAVLFLAGQILAGPLLFVIIALVRNAFQWHLPKSDASAIQGAIIFCLLLLGIAVSLALYGQWFFSSADRITGATRDWAMSKMESSCVQRQNSLKQGANPSDDQISKYCRCLSIKLADNTTYKRLTSDSNSPDVREYLKQQAEAAGQACQVWAR